LIPAKATFALKAGVWFRRGRLLIVAPVHKQACLIRDTRTTYPAVLVSRATSFLTGSRIGFCSNHCMTGNREPDMLTGMTERDWSIVLEVFDAAQSSRGEPGHDDRKFLEALHYFTVHSITWRALPSEFGKWNSVWKRFWRLSRSGVFEAFFQLLAECSQTAHLVQFFDSTTARAHVSAAGAKGGSTTSPSAAHAAVSRPKSISRPISMATLSTST
jgi:transposase